MSAYQPQGVDEIGLWREYDESERRLAASALVVRDAKLTGYLKQVLCRTVGDDRCNAVRVYVIREPIPNASMAPNGTMRVHSGMLLRIRSESELGALLGHEFGHYEQRHGLNKFKARRTGTDVIAWAGLLAAMARTYDTARSYHDLKVSVYGDLYRYSRNLEREADLLSVGYLNSSNLKPQAASRIWENMMAEAEASARAKGMKKPNFEAIAFSASHPPDAERAAYLSALAEPTAFARDDGAAQYSQALKEWLPIFLDDQIKLNDFGASEFIILSLADTGWTAPLWLGRAELYRARGNPRDLVNAVDFYRAALDLDPTLGTAYRGLGLALMKIDQSAEATVALHKYLELRPDAPDAGMIRMMLPKEGTSN
ncbi:MAG: M48 family metalloprotease [Tsuneonella sp.]